MGRSVGCSSQHFSMMSYLCHKNKTTIISKGKCKLAETYPLSIGEAKHSTFCVIRIKLSGTYNCHKRIYAIKVRSIPILILWNINKHRLLTKALHCGIFLLLWNHLRKGGDGHSILGEQERCQAVINYRICINTFLFSSGKQISS